jgi:ubiquinone/menaquinone biosynthesis C-methylase UbiE
MIARRILSFLEAALSRQNQPDSPATVARVGDEQFDPSLNESSEEYWTRINVTDHKQFQSAEESLDFFDWRCRAYSNYLESMPVAGFDGREILDYGCGPGHDLVGFWHFSKPSRLVGIDVSTTSLAEAHHRLKLHNANVQLIRIRENQLELPLADATFDVIHSSGVLHHTPDPAAILREFRRLIRKDGHVQIMVYNRNTVFVHLHVAYHVMLKTPGFENLSLDEAFTRSTDGPNCPISRCYTPTEFLELARAAGFRGKLAGCSVSLSELNLVPTRTAALADPAFPAESRRFLYDLTFDNRGRPMHGEHIAGIGACFHLTPA